MSVQAIILGAVVVQKTIEGIAAAYPDAPSSLNQFPCFVNYADEGDREWPRQPNRQVVTHNFFSDLYVQKGGDLAAADRLLKPFVDLVITAFDLNITLGGSCLQAGVVHYKFSVMKYGDVDYLGIRFTLKAVEYQTVAYHG